MFHERYLGIFFLFICLVLSVWMLSVITRWTCLDQACVQRPAESKSNRCPVSSGRENSEDYWMTNKAAASPQERLLQAICIIVIAPAANVCISRFCLAAQKPQCSLTMSNGSRAVTGWLYLQPPHEGHPREGCSRQTPKRCVGRILGKLTRFRASFSSLNILLAWNASQYPSSTTY